jgi:hypothetical protein
VQSRRIGLLACERVGGRDAGELRLAAQQYRDPQAEVALDAPFDRGRNALRITARPEDDVPALDVGDHVLVSESFEQLAQVRHRDLVP